METLSSFPVLGIPFSITDAVLRCGKATQSNTTEDKVAAGVSVALAIIDIVTAPMIVVAGLWYTVQNPTTVQAALAQLPEPLPRIAHVGVLFDPGDAMGKSQVKDFEQAAARLKMRIAPLEIRRGADIEPALKRGAELKIEACALAFGALSNVHSQAIADGVRRSKLPSISGCSSS